ncbi:hypothetical protein Tco_0641232, partial [Tanacetum coccineum]
MMNYLKNQGTWKITQLKKLSFEEVKEEFDKLVKQIESFAPISFEATKASLKRFGEELQTKTPKRLKEEKDDEAKDDESTKKSGKRRKQMARKGIHTSVDENDSEDSDKVDKHEESNTGTETPINPVPVAMKTPSVATYKIIKQGEKGVYQIVREDGTDIVYINFGAMLKSISRDDLTELYRKVNTPGSDENRLKLYDMMYKVSMFAGHLKADGDSEPAEQRPVSSSHDTLAPLSEFALAPIAFRPWRAAPLSTPYPPTTSDSSLGSSSEKSIAPTPIDLLPPRKRFRGSYSLENSIEEHIKVDTADAEAVADVGISKGVVAHTGDGVGMRVKIAASDVREDDKE